MEDFREVPVSKTYLILPRDCGGEYTATGWPIMVMVDRDLESVTIVDEDEIVWSDYPHVELKSIAVLYTFSHEFWGAVGFYRYN